MDLLPWTTTCNSSNGDMKTYNNQIHPEKDRLQALNQQRENTGKS